jgi:DNA-binding transcriptional ArsR family regulator
MSAAQDNALPILPDSVPVMMPELPARLSIKTPEQLSALGDPLRDRILSIIQQQPRTAKQLATQLDKSTGSIGHQLRVLERAGLAQIVALRMTRGIVAKYYARTARLFVFDVDTPAQSEPRQIQIVRYGLADLREAIAEQPAPLGHASYPRVRLNPDRARYYDQKVRALIDELLAEPQQNGDVWALLVAFFQAPRYDAPENQ